LNTDQAFDSIVASHFLELSQSTEYEAIKHISALVVNDTPRDVRAYSIKWVLTLADGTQEVSYRTAMLQSSLLLPGSGSALESTSTAFVTPIAEMSDNDRLSHALKAQRIAAKYLSNDIHTKYAHATVVSVKLDAIVFSDGAVRGEDKSGLLKRFTCERNGAIYEARALVPFLGKPDTLRQQLITDQFLMYKTEDPNDVTDCRNSQGRAAIRLRSILADSGEETLEDTIRKTSVAGLAQLRNLNAIR
jgi:hypothetical protein